VLLREGTSSAVVLVDALLSELEVVVSPLGERSAEGINGAALLPDGATALVLNVPEIVRRTSVDRATPAHGGDDRQRRVLVVDDSITTRTLERSLLEDAGYAVTVAIDGEAGWKTLTEGQFDVMVADVEMPELDGLSLCRRVRADPRLRGTPIILVTSLDTPADRQRGVEAGADAYLAKADFDRDVLVETIARLLDESA
jgi:two-component system chemotaxis sensor kinase CheA